MIQAFWFDLNRVGGDRGRPADIEPYKTRKVVILGAGMMGAAIAYVSASAGIEVVLKDVSLEAAERGKQYSVNLVNKAIDRGRSTTEKGEALLALIHPSDKPADAAGADLVIEAVFEDPNIKEQVWKEIEPHAWRPALLAPTPRPCRSPGLPSTSRAPMTSSASISSHRWTRCRWSS